MPVFEVDTNTPAEKFTPAILEELTTLWAGMLGLDIKYMSVIVRPNPLMMWAGTSEPCAACRLTAINGVNEEKNREYTEKVFKFMSEKLGTPGDRMYVIYTSPPNTHVGHKGMLFSDIMKK